MCVYLQIDEHGDVDEEGEQGHRHDVHGQVLPPRIQYQMLWRMRLKARPFKVKITFQPRKRSSFQRVVHKYRQALKEVKGLVTNV